MKILYIANIPSPYRVKYFNELGKSCELTVLFEKSNSDERDESWKDYKFENFKGIILNGKKITTDSALCPSVTKYIDKSYDAVVCCDFLFPTGMLAVNYMKKNKIPYFLESDGGFAKNGSGIKEKIKKFIIPGAAGYFSTSKEHDNYYLHYGAKFENIYRYPFTSLENKDILNRVLTKDEKNILKEKLNIKEKTVIMSVGQFIFRKGFDILLESSKGLINENAALYIIGGNATDEYKEICRKYNMNNVYFLDFMSPAELAEYYKASDLFIMPTREDIWGLVINEAMAYGLPVISSDRCIAGNELVHENENGFIFRSENVEDLHYKIKILLENPDKMTEFAVNSLKIISKYSFEEMAKCHMEIFNKLIGEK